MHYIWTKFLFASTVVNFAICSGAIGALAQPARVRQFRAVASPRGSAPAQMGKANPALQPYLTRIQNKLNKNWYLPDGNNHVTLTVNVATDGNATDAVAVGSPKSQPAETAAMDAFNNSAPLEPLPSGVNSGKLILKFDSMADPHGDSHSNISVRFEPAPAAAAATAAPATAPELPATTAAQEPAAPAMVPGTLIPTSAYATDAAAAAAASVAKAAASAPAAQGIPSNAAPREALPVYVPPSAAAAAQAAAASPTAQPALEAPTALPVPSSPADLLKSLP